MTAQSAWIVGAFSTTFGKKPEQGFKALTREVYLGVLADAGMEDGEQIGSAWFGNCGMHAVGQGSIRGQVCFIPLVREGLFPARVPMVNVENACATGSSAAQGAWKDVSGGHCHLSLAIGVEKLFNPNPKADSKGGFAAGIDVFDTEEWRAYYAAAGETIGRPFESGADRSLFMDTYAMQAAWHMQRHGTTQRQIAVAAAKTHNFGAANSLAQYRFEMTPDQVLEDRPVSWPLTRAMCAPIGDGAAALLVCSGEYLASLPASSRDRAVRIRSFGAAGGKYRALDEPGLSQVAERRAYEMANVAPSDIDVAEVHDATSFSEIYQCEMMGFCGEGQGGRFIEDGGGGLESRVAINTSGGLVSKGHPVDATGCSMLCELVVQLRGEAGARQKAGARLALAENGGGAVGFDEAVCVVTILERR